MNGAIFSFLMSQVVKTWPLSLLEPPFLPHAQAQTNPKVNITMILKLPVHGSLRGRESPKSRKKEFVLEQ